MRRLQVKWHPRSKLHFAVLTSDNTLAIFSTRQLVRPEQAFKLPVRNSVGFGIGAMSPGAERSGQAGAGGSLHMVDFAFGAGAGWDVLSVYLLSWCAAHLVQGCLPQT